MNPETVTLNSGETITLADFIAIHAVVPEAVVLRRMAHGWSAINSALWPIWKAA